MSELLCYRCGVSLGALSLPLSRLDECPACSVYLHCCRMCRYYDPAVTKQCTEDDAEEVRDKTRANFCDYFAPSEGRFDPALTAGEDRARHALDALFGKNDGDTDRQSGPDDAVGDAEDLFR